ncbi:glycosyltransferase [Micromonospora sp. NPDC047738]|uniref:glycosyltransferase n=1 Tax=Micromonospora sp. NPDC047738 TaxID=3155741 RepID=UPI0033D1BBF9
MDQTATTSTAPSPRAVAAPASPRLLVLSAFRFPHGDAMSNRLLQLARSAAPAGGTVLVVNDWPDDGSRPDPAPVLPPEVQLLTLTSRAHGRLLRWLRRQTRPVRVLRALRRAGVRRGKVSGVYIPLNLFNLTTWAALRAVLRVPVLVDVLERHDPGQFPRGRLAPYFLRHRWSSLLAGRLASRVVAVSETLGAHYAGHGRPVLVVPPQVDCAQFTSPAPPPLASGLRILYAGSPGLKDLLAVVLQGLARLPAPERQRVQLVVAGVSRLDAPRSSDLDAGLLDTDSVAFLGRVPRERVLAELRRSHFSVLVRPDAGYAHAGFPSKVPESLAAGCPVLLNHTSDLARYVSDGREGIVLDGPTAEDVRRGLHRALQLDDSQWRRMSQAALARARDFDYRAWTPIVRTFVSGVVDASNAPGRSAFASGSSSPNRRSAG